MSGREPGRSYSEQSLGRGPRVVQSNKKTKINEQFFFECPAQRRAPNSPSLVPPGAVSASLWRAAGEREGHGQHRYRGHPAPLASVSRTLQVCVMNPTLALSAIVSIASDEHVREAGSAVPTGCTSISHHTGSGESVGPGQIVDAIDVVISSVALGCRGGVTFGGVGVGGSVAGAGVVGASVVGDAVAGASVVGTCTGAAVGGSESNCRSWPFWPPPATGEEVHASPVDPPHPTSPVLSYGQPVVVTMATTVRKPKVSPTWIGYEHEVCRNTSVTTLPDPSRSSKHVLAENLPGSGWVVSTSGDAIGRVGGQGGSKPADRTNWSEPPGQGQQHV